MATYVEQAVFRVTDNASGPLGKIQAQLKALEVQARRLQSVMAGVRPGGTGATGTGAAINQVQSALIAAQRRQIGAIDGSTRAIQAGTRADIDRQIRSAQVEARRRRAEDRGILVTERATLAAERASNSRQIRSAQVERRRQALEERELAEARRAADARLQANQIRRDLARGLGVPPPPGGDFARTQAAINAALARARTQFAAEMAATQRQSRVQSLIDRVTGRNRAAATSVDAQHGAQPAHTLHPSMLGIFSGQPRQDQQGGGAASAALAAGAGAGVGAGSAARMTRTTEQRVADIAARQARLDGASGEARAVLDKAIEVSKARRLAAEQAAEKAARSGAQRDLNAAEMRRRRAQLADAAVAAARAKLEVAESNQKLGRIRAENTQRAAVTMDARRQQREAAAAASQPSRASETLSTVRGMLPYVAAGGALALSQRVVSTAKTGITDAQNQRMLSDIFDFEGGQRKALDKASDRTSKEFLTQSRAQFEELGRDVMLFTRPDKRTPENVAAIMDTVAASATMLTMREKGDSTRGTEIARQIVRATENLGRADDPEQAKQYIEEITKAALMGGRDWNARMFAQAIAQIGPQNTGGLSSRFVGLIANMQDDVRGQMAPIVRTFMDNVTRSSITDKAMELQKEAGLRDDTGQRIDGAMFARDPDLWIRKHIQPKIEAAAGGQAAFRALSEEQQYDVSSRTLQRLGLTSSGARFAAYVVNRQAELERLEVDRSRIKVDKSTAQKLTRENLQMAASSVARQFENLASNAPGQSLVASIMAGLASGLGKLSASLLPNRDALPGQRASLQPSAATQAAALGALGIGMAAKYAIENPGAIALVGAGAKLTGSAVALSAAAARLSTAGALGATGGVLGAGGAAAAGGAAGAAARAGGMLLRGAGVVGAGILAYDAYQWLQQNVRRLNPDGHGGTEAARDEHARRLQAETRAREAADAKQREVEQMKPMLGGAFDAQGRWRGGTIRGYDAASLAEMDALEAAKRPRSGGLAAPGIIETLRDGAAAVWRELFGIKSAGAAPGDPTSANQARTETQSASAVFAAAIGASITSSAASVSAAIGEGASAGAAAMSSAIAAAGETAGASMAAQIAAAVANISVTSGGSNSSVGPNPGLAR